MHRVLRLQEQMAVMQGPGTVGQPGLRCVIMNNFSIETQDLQADICSWHMPCKFLVEVEAGMQTSEKLIATSIDLQQLVRSRPGSKKCPSSWLALWTVTFLVAPSGA